MDTNKTVNPSTTQEPGKYWIPKNRYYELKYFCLQYPDWQKEHDELATHQEMTISETMRFSRLGEVLEMVKECAIAASLCYGYTILDAVTHGIPYVKLCDDQKITLSKEEYYDIYKRFFWLLDDKKGL